MKYLILILALSFAVLNSCTDDKVDYTAQKMTLKDIENTSSFTFFNYDYNNYQPDTSKISLIKSEYKPDVYKFVFFVSPSCYVCNGYSKYFAYGAKTLTNAAIPDSAFVIYAMKAESDDHPYGDFYINKFPELCILKNGVPFYSIIDTVVKLDTFKLLGKYDGTDTTIESQIAIALSK